MLVWVLPTVKSATVEPNLTLIRMTDPPSPGPTVRTFVEMELLQQANLPLKGKAGTAAELLDRFLPDGVASWQTAIDKDIITDTPAPNLRFHLQGLHDAELRAARRQRRRRLHDRVQRRRPRLLRAEPCRRSIDNDYAIGDPSIAALGAVDTFDTHLVHQNKAGASPLTGNVAIAFMGGAQDSTARIVVAGTRAGADQDPQTATRSVQARRVRSTSPSPSPTRSRRRC